MVVVDPGGIRTRRGPKKRYIVLGVFVLLLLVLFVTFFLLARHRATVQPLAAEVGRSPLAGEHLFPYVCTTRLLDLGEPEGPDCEIETQVEFFALRPFEVDKVDDPTSLPDDIIQLDLPDVGTVPALVRLETGTINRSVYRVAMLAQPTDGEEDTPFTCLLYTSPSPRDQRGSRMPSSA